MPRGLLGLVAVGVHASADSVDDRIRWLIEQLDASVDSVFADFEFSRSWVDAIGSVERTHVARALALLWEIAVDVAIALPALGYFEATQREALMEPTKSWRVLVGRAKAKPTPMRIVRPVVAAGFAGAGADALPPQV